MDINTEHTIFQALTARHDIQRVLCDKLEKLIKNNELQQAKDFYPQLDIELKAHATAEERHLYVPVMSHDDGMDLSRHAIAEHHEMDEMMATLNDGRTSDDNWLKTCEALIHEVRHHLKEEENKFFKDAKTLLDKETQQRLGSLYQVEHHEFETNHG